MNIEQRILKTLKDFGRLPTNRIAAIIGIEYYRALKELEMLSKENKIVSEAETQATYWSLKE